jgi:hypothetical protein
VAAASGNKGAPELIAGLEWLLGRPIARRAPARKPSGHTTAQLDLLQLVWCRRIAVYVTIMIEKWPCHDDKATH